MAERATVTVELTREQQLAVLAATGLLVKTLEMDPGAVEAEGAVTAQVPLPQWMVQKPAAG